MAHEIAKLLLEHADTFLDRVQAIKKAHELGMPLHQIEQYLDWLDATRGPLVGNGNAGHEAEASSPNWTWEERDSRKTSPPDAPDRPDESEHPEASAGPDAAASPDASAGPEASDRPDAIGGPEASPGSRQEASEPDGKQSESS